MRLPVENFQDWNNTAGLSYGDPTDYGFHDGDDLNFKGGGDSDLGMPLYIIADGKIVESHSHTKVPSFGKHYLVEISGPWGTRWVHYAHNKDFWGSEGQLVKEGSSVSTVGKSGTGFAHCHFAIMKKRLPLDTICGKNRAQLEDWEDPLLFIKTWINYVQPPQGGDDMDPDKTLLTIDAALRSKPLLAQTPDDLTRIKGYKNSEWPFSDETIYNYISTVVRDDILKPSLEEKERQILELTEKLKSEAARNVELEGKIATEHGNQHDFGTQALEAQKALEEEVKAKELLIRENSKLVEMVDHWRAIALAKVKQISLRQYFKLVIEKLKALAND